MAPLTMTLGRRRDVRWTGGLLAVLIVVLMSPAAAFAGPGSLVSGVAWLDTNRDQTRQAGEPAESGVTVQLLTSPGGAVVGTATTTSSGAYQFADVADGSYTVVVTAPSALLTFPATASGSNGFRLTGAPPAGQNAKGTSSVITIAGASQQTGLDAGLQPVATVVAQQIPITGDCQDLATTGTAPFDATDGDGEDSSASNCLVRSSDVITQNYAVSLNGLPAGASVDNVIAEFTISSADGAKAHYSGPQGGGLPNGCLTSGVNPASSIVTNPDGSVTLRCNLGTFTGSTLKPVSVPVTPDTTSPNNSHVQMSMRAYASAGTAAPSATVTGPAVEVTGRPQWDASKSGWIMDSRPRTQTVMGQTRTGYLFRYLVVLRNISGAGKGGLDLAAPVSMTDQLPNLPNGILVGCNPTQNQDGSGYGATPGTISCPPLGSTQGSGWDFTVTSFGGGGKTAYAYHVDIFVPEEDVYAQVQPGWQPGDPKPTGQTFDVKNDIINTQGWHAAGGEPNNQTGFEPGWNGTTASGNNVASFTVSTNVILPDASGGKGYTGVQQPLTTNLHGQSALVPDTDVGSQVTLTTNSEATITNPTVCDVFDVSVFRLQTPLSTPPAGYLYEYAVGPNSTNLQNGPVGSNRLYPFDSSSLQTAVAGCKTFAGPWSNDPTTLGANWQDTVNMVRMRPIDPATSIGPNTSIYLRFNLHSRQFYNGGPHAGEEIPAGVQVPNEGGYDDPGNTTTGWSTNEAVDQFWRVYVDSSKSASVGTVMQGDPVTWTIRPELIARTGEVVHDVTVTDTLPATLNFDASCTQDALPPGVTVSYNAATRQVVFTYGDRTVGVRNFFLPTVDLCTNVSPTAAAGSTITNQSSLTSPDSFNTSTASASTRINASDSLALGKQVDHPFVEPGQTFTWTLTWLNTSNTISFQAPDIIDVLPWNGDGAAGSLSPREQYSSDFSGTHRLTGALAQPTYTAGGTGDVSGTWYYATAAPNTINHNGLDASNANPQAPGGLWQTAAEIQAGPGFVAVTAVRFVSTGNITPGQTVQATMPETATSNQLNNVYVDRAALASASFPGEPLLSNEPYVFMPGWSLGDYVWRDDNGNGVHNAGEPGIAGVPIQVLDANGDVVATATTDADGRWFVEGLGTGTYRVRIPGSAFGPGGPLVDHQVATTGSNLSPDANETADNNNTATPNPAVTGLTSTPVTFAYTRDTEGYITGGNAPLGDNVAGIGSDVVPDDFTNFTIDLTVQGIPRLSVAKTADRTVANYAGDVVNYSFDVSNDGTTGLDDVTVTDMLTAPAGPELTVTCPRTSLAAHESMTCTAAYTVTQSDVDNGNVRDIAVAHATTPTGVELDSPEDAYTVAIVPALTVVKTATSTAPRRVGETISYRIRVANTSNASITDITVIDRLDPPAGPRLTVTCPGTILGPGESMVCTTSPYVLTAADVGKGNVTNTAHAIGVTPNGSPVTSLDSTAKVTAAAAVVPVPVQPGTGSQPGAGSTLPSTDGPTPDRFVLAGFITVLGVLMTVFGYRGKRSG